MKKLILTLIILSGVILTTSAKLWRVNNTPGVNADFSTLSAAHNGASEGDTLYIEGSPTSYGDLTVSKKLILIGPGYFLNENDMAQASKLTAILGSLTINGNADGSVITGLRITRLYNQANYVVITRNYVYGPDTNYDGIHIARDGNALHDLVISQNFCRWIRKNRNVRNVLIFNNIVLYDISMGTASDEFTGVIKNNVVANTIEAVYAEIKNNIIYNTDGGGYKILTGSTYSYNLFAGNTVPSGTGNVASVDMNSVFSDFASKNVDNDFALKQGSPASGAGENGTDCGAFGGDQPYVLSGIPAVPHIYEAIIPTSASTDSGLKVHFKIKTNN